MHYIKMRDFRFIAVNVFTLKYNLLTRVVNSIILSSV